MNTRTLLKARLPLDKLSLCVGAIKILFDLPSVIESITGTNGFVIELKLGGSNHAPAARKTMHF
jgi:hypothetical protein